MSEPSSAVLPEAKPRGSVNTVLFWPRGGVQVLPVTGMMLGGASSTLPCPNTKKVEAVLALPQASMSKRWRGLGSPLSSDPGKLLLF